ncbi:hypothetical protein F5Y17DRAFT_425334 [Xylariaceae sp. FL0594]|nr:hypothetical protein F5Y17DRAFT_425334 [Xylariaceae sp. FL0594]
MTSSDRYFENLATSAQTVDAKGELLASLKRLTKFYPPVHTCSTDWSFSGLYTGPTSISFLFYRLSHLYPDVEFDGQSFLEWAQAYLKLGTRAQAQHKRAPSPSHCGIGNETLVHLALSALIEEDTGKVRRLCKFAGAVNETDADASNEWLYGRAGYLYLLRLCYRSDAFSKDRHPSTSAMLEETIKETVERILGTPQPWTWHGKQYLGAAHGVIGIITQVVLSLPSTASRLQPLLLGLLERQFPSGNFPSSVPVGSDRLVQFCHGGPGFIMSLRNLLPHFPDIADKVKAAVDNAREDTWKRGLLTKEPCLCHGIAGNALAFEDDVRFSHFLSFMGSEKLEQMTGEGVNNQRDTEKAGLFTGGAGRAWCWAVADKGLAKTCIGYDDV